MSVTARWGMRLEDEQAAKEPVRSSSWAEQENGSDGEPGRGLSELVVRRSLVVQCSTKRSSTSRQRARRAGAGRSSGRRARRRACARHAVGAQCSESHRARRVLLRLIDARMRRCRSTAAGSPHAVCEPRWARAALSRRRPLQRGSVQLQGVLQTGARAASVVLCPRTQLGSAAARRGGRCGWPCRARRDRVARDACRRG